MLDIENVAAIIGSQTTFTVTTDGQNRLGLRERCQRYVDEQWVAAHMTDEQAAESLLDQFKRAVSN